jgi:hypothetical protein
MAAKLRSWWQNIQKPLEVMGLLVGCLLLMGLLGVVVLAYVFQVNVSGLQGKTLWDWFQLLIILAVLALGGSLFTFTTTRIGQEATRQRDQTERELTGDNQREAALQSYMDNIAELLLEKHLRESHPADEVRTIARVRTLTTLPRLDKARKGSVLHFLHEAQLIEQGQSLIALSDADLSDANLSGANLSDADLSGADITQPQLNGTRLLQDVVLPDGSRNP